MSSYATLNPSFVTSGHYRKNNATFMAKERKNDSKFTQMTAPTTDTMELFERAYCKVLFDNKIPGTG